MRVKIGVFVYRGALTRERLPDILSNSPSLLLKTLLCASIFLHSSVRLMREMFPPS